MLISFSDFDQVYTTSTIAKDHLRQSGSCYSRRVLFTVDKLYNPNEEECMLTRPSREAKQTVTPDRKFYFIMT